MSAIVGARSRCGELAVVSRTLSGVRLFLGASADGRCSPGRRGHARGVPCSGPARAKTAEENRARGLALPRHSRRQPEAQTKAHWPTQAALAVDFPEDAPGVAAGRDAVESPRAPNGSRAGTIAD